MTRPFSAAERAACIAAHRTGDWREFDRLRFGEAPKPIISWTYSKRRGADRLSINEVTLPLQTIHGSFETGDDGADEDAAARLRRYALDRKARRVAEWIYDYLVLRGYIRARAQ